MPIFMSIFLNLGGLREHSGTETDTKPTQKFRSQMSFIPTNAYKRVVATFNLGVGKSWEDYNLETLNKNLKTSYLVCGKETASTGQKHFQSYMEWGRKKLGSAMIAAARKTFPLPCSIHFQNAKGSQEQNLTYCTKEDKEPFIKGEPGPSQGARNDLATMFQMVKDGASDADLVETDAHKWAMHRKAFSDYRLLQAKNREQPSRLLFLWGPTGSGKTAAAMEGEPEVINISSGRFMIGYTGSGTSVCFDDFDWRQMEPKYWLRLCDRYAMTVEVKGAVINWNPEHIIFTSNDDPLTWWTEGKNKAPDATLEAIHRRMEEFGEIRYLGDPIPRGEAPKKILADYFKLKPKGPHAGAAPPIVEDSGSENESDYSQLSAHSVKRRRLSEKRDDSQGELVDRTP